MSKVKLNKIDRFFLVLMCVIVLGIVAFWVGWYTGLLATSYSVPDAMQFTLKKYEQAFVSSDIWTALLLILSVVSISKGNKIGYFFAGLAGACLIYLAGMDITFLIQNSLYHYLPIEMFINSVCILSGISLIFYSCIYFVREHVGIF